MPEADRFGSSEELESFALSARLDLEMQRQDVEIVDKARSLRHWGAFTAVQLGASTERGPETVRVTGPTLQMELPVFNRGQADRMRLSAQLRQSQDKLAALELTVRSEVRETLAQVEAARTTVEEYHTNIGPLRAKAVNLAQQRYNAMTLSALDLLSAKQEQIGARLEEIEALRDYWIHWVELERAAGGRLPSKTIETKGLGKD
jgi:cobalt-zinc-cadmium efflux system outer membrane protein